MVSRSGALPTESYREYMEFRINMVSRVIQIVVTGLGLGLVCFVADLSQLNVVAKWAIICAPLFVGFFVSMAYFIIACTRNI